MNFRKIFLYGLVFWMTFQTKLCSSDIDDCEVCEEEKCSEVTNESGEIEESCSCVAIEGCETSSESTSGDTSTTDEDSGGGLGCFCSSASSSDENIVKTGNGKVLVSYSDPLLTYENNQPNFTFSLQLDTYITYPVTINISSTNSSAGVPSVNSVTFNSSDWGTPKFISINSPFVFSGAYVVNYTINMTTNTVDDAYISIVPPPITLTHTFYNDKKMFVTQNTYTGDFSAYTGATGIEKADNACTSDANYPGLGTYKALIVDGINRTACNSANCVTSGISEHINWPFLSNTVYWKISPLAAVLKTNDTAIFEFPLNNSLLTTGLYFWTGLNTDYTPGANNCTNWSDGTTAASGGTGSLSATDSTVLFYLDNLCSSSYQLVCVEQ